MERGGKQAMAFDKYASPKLPSPPKTYDTTYFLQLVRAIQNFFTIVASDAAMNAAIMTPTMLRTPQHPLVLADGNTDALALPSHTYFRIEGPTAGFSLRGINSDNRTSNDGRQIILQNASGQAMTIVNEEAAVIAENRILTGVGVDITVADTGSAYMIYSIKDLRWIVIAHSS